MKHIIFLIFCGLLFSVGISAQKPETFDIISFKTPKGWKKEVQQNGVQMGVENANGGICLITLFKAIPSGGGDSKANFETAWEAIVKETVTVKTAPQMNDPADENGWTVESGLAQYESGEKKGIVMLLTATGNGKMVNALVLTNTDAYQKDITDFLESISLPKITPQQTATPLTNNDNSDNTAIVGTWDMNASEKTGYSANNYMISGYVNRQYTFNANGTYNFYMKTYQMALDKMFLTKENGTYQISGNTLVINPQKNVIEAWSRQGNNDIWGKKLNTQNLALEKASYQFKKEYFSEANEWKLFLQAAQQTKRDGSFSFSSNNTWAYIITSPTRPVLKLPNE